MELSNVFNVVSEEELSDFGVYLRRVLPTPQAQEMLKKSIVAAEEEGDFASADMIRNYVTKDDATEIDLDNLDELDSFSIASWLFDCGHGTLAVV